MTRATARPSKSPRACERQRGSATWWPHLAGDQFVLLINDASSRGAAEEVRLHVEAALRAPLTSIDLSALPGGALIDGAVGLALHPFDGDSADDLVRYADRDMYERKRASRAT